MTPNELSKHYKAYNTPALCFQSKEQSLLALSRESRRQDVEFALSIHITALNDYLCQKSGMKRDHVEFVVGVILDEYKWLNMADINLIINRIKSNYYGEFYENFNGQKLLGIFAKYNEERMCEIERIRDEENQGYRRTPITGYYSSAKEFYDTHKSVIEVEEEERKERELQRQEEYKQHLAKMKKIEDEALRIHNETGRDYVDCYNELVFDILKNGKTWQNM